VKKGLRVRGGNRTLPETNGVQSSIVPAEGVTRSLKKGGEGRGNRESNRTAENDP